MALRVSLGQATATSAAPWLIHQAGGSLLSNFASSRYRVCLEMPTRAAKSPAGSPLRRQVSSSSSRCSGVVGAEVRVAWAGPGVGPCGGAAAWRLRGGGPAAPGEGGCSAAVGRERPGRGAAGWERVECGLVIVLR